MNGNDVSKFNIPIDEESPDSQFQEDVEELEAVKINKRITRTALLTITLMGVIILFAYIDLKKNLSKMSSSGNTEIQTLSNGMHSKFSSLLLQQAKLEKILADKITPLEKTVGSMQADLKEQSTAIKQIRSAIKSDNKKTADAIEAIEKTVTPLSITLENLASDVNGFKQKYSNELSNLSRMATDVQRHIRKLQSDTASLSSSQIDKKRLDIELSNERSIYQKRLGQFQSDMAARILSIEKRLKELENINVSLQEHRTAKPTAAQSSQSQKSNPADNNTLRQPGTIIEQDIQYHGLENTTSDPK